MSKSHLQFALAALELKQFETARREAIAELTQNPESAWAHLVAGEACMRLGQFASGRNHAADVIRTSPEWGWGHWLLGWCWLLDYQYDSILAKTTRLSNASKAATRAAQCQPDEPVFLALAATVELERGLVQEAQDTIGRGLTIAPDFQPLHRLRGLTYRFLNDSNLAMDSLQTSLRLKPDDAISHRDLASVLFERGNFQKAHEHIKEAMRLDPTDWFGRDLQLKISQTQHWLPSFLLRFSHATRYIRFLFPWWLIATVLLGLPFVFWAETGGRDYPLLVGIGTTAWIVIILAPLETLLLPWVVQSLWILLGREACHQSLSRQAWWERGAPGVAFLVAIPVILFSLAYTTPLVFDFFSLLVAVGVFQSYIATISRQSVRRFAYFIAAVYVISMASLSINAFMSPALQDDEATFLFIMPVILVTLLCRLMIRRSI